MWLSWFRKRLRWKFYKRPLLIGNPHESMPDANLNWSWSRSGSDPASILIWSCSDSDLSRGLQQLILDWNTCLFRVFYLPRARIVVKYSNNLKYRQIDVRNIKYRKFEIRNIHYRKFDLHSIKYSLFEIRDIKYRQFELRNIKYRQFEMHDTEYRLQQWSQQ